MNLAILGDRLSKFRRARGLTLHRLGELSGVGSSHIGNYEQGQLPKLTTLAKIASALGVTAHDLLDEVHNDKQAI